MQKEITLREAQVVAQLLSGKTNAEIGEALSLAEKTVKYHLSYVYKKLGVESRNQLITLYFSEDITPAQVMARFIKKVEEPKRPGYPPEYYGDYTLPSSEI